MCPSLRHIEHSPLGGGKPLQISTALFFFTSYPFPEPTYPVSTFLVPPSALQLNKTATCHALVRLFLSGLAGTSTRHLPPIFGRPWGGRCGRQLQKQALRQEKKGTVTQLFGIRLGGDPTASLDATAVAKGGQICSLRRAGRDARKRLGSLTGCGHPWW